MTEGDHPMILTYVTLAISIAAAAAALASARYARIAGRLNKETARIRAEGNRIRGQRIKAGAPPSMPVPPPPPAAWPQVGRISPISSPLLEWLRRAAARQDGPDAPD
jgi:hypothetical protein